MKKLKYIAVFLLVFFAAIIGFIAEQPTAAEAVQDDPPSYVARVGGTNYESFFAAWGAASNNDTIYILNNAYIYSGITVNKNITITSDGDRKILTRANSGDIFTISGTYTLTFENIIFNGNNLYTDSGSQALVKIAGSLSTNPVLIINTGTEIYNFKTDNGSPVIQMNQGTLSMDGGKIYNNTSDVGYSTIYASESMLNFFGGEIYGNSTGASSFGAIFCDNTVSVNISGSIIIKDNTRSDSVKQNLQMTNLKKLNVMADFTGEVCVYSDFDERYGEFGIIAYDADIIGTGIIRNDRNINLFGVKVGSNVIWDYDYSSEIITKPTTSTAGLSRQTTIGANPAETIDVTLPVLSEEDYYITFDTFTDTDPKITYTLKDHAKGIINIEYPLPEIDDSGYVWMINSTPEIYATGAISASHNDYPGLGLSGIILPKLNDVAYTVTYTAPTATTSGILTYKYKALDLPSLVFSKILLDVDSMEATANSVTFYAYYYLKYIVIPSSATVDSNTEWEVVEYDSLTFDITQDIEYTVYAKPIYEESNTDTTYTAFSFISKSPLLLSKENALSQLNAYVTNPSDAVQAIITSTIDSINADNYASVENIISQAKAKIDLQEAKEDAIKSLQEKYNDLIQKKDYNSKNLSILNEYLQSAIDNINSALTLTAVQEQLSLVQVQLETIPSSGNSLNLWWLVILLSVIILAEIAFIILLIRKSRKERAQAFLGVIALTIIPNGAIAAVSVLGAVAVALAAFIVFLIIKQKKDKKLAPKTNIAFTIQVEDNAENDKENI